MSDMSDVHICWSPATQPATRFKIEIPQKDWRATPKYQWITMPAHRRAWCFNCGARRYLKNMRILEQAWYDPKWFCVQCPPKKKRKRRRTA